MISLVAFEVVAVWTLHRLGATPYVGFEVSAGVGWLHTAPIDRVLMSAVWFAALLLGWWTLGSTLLYLVVRVSGRRDARLARRLAFPVVRHLVDRSLATVLVGSALLGAAPAVAAARPHQPTAQYVSAPAASEYEPRPAGTEGPAPDGADASERPSPAIPGTPRRAPRPLELPTALQGRPSEPTPGDGAGDEDTRPADRRGTSGPAAERSAAERTAGRDRRTDGAADRVRRGEPVPGRRYTVRSGDSLWKIAATVVGTREAHDERAVAAYWIDLVRTAAPSLRSGDPDLIYPGEQIVLPDLPTGPRDGR